MNFLKRTAKDLPRPEERAYHCDVIIWSNPGLITSIVGPPSPLNGSIIKPCFIPGVPETPESDSLLGLYKGGSDLCHYHEMGPVQVGSGILDSNGTEITHAPLPPSTLLGNYLAKIVKFADEPSFSAIPASGQYLEQLEVADAQLKSVQSLLRRWSDDVERKAASYLDSPVDAPYIELPLFGQSVLADFNDQCLPPFYSLGALSSVRDSAKKIKVLEQSIVRLRRRVHQKAKAIKRSFFRSVPRFCGLAWSRRLWFLLHGSHPPKASAFLPA